MAYQNVGTPRFFIDTLLFYRSQGIGSPDINEDVFSLNPSGGVSRNFGDGVGGNDGRAWLDYRFNSPTPLGVINYIAFLGHDQGNAYSLSFRHPGTGYMKDLQDTNILTEYVNCKFQGDETGYSGFSIGLVDYNSETGTFDDNSENFNDPNGLKSVSFAIYGKGADSTAMNESTGLPFRIGSASIGSIYDMPHSPDLKLTMSREMDGVKRIRTKGGNDLVNHKYIKPAMWGGAGAWELYDVPYYTLQIGQNPLEGGTWGDDAYTWINDEGAIVDYGVKASKSINISDIFTIHPELDGKIYFINSLADGTASYHPDSGLWGGGLVELVKGQYYKIISNQSVTSPLFTSGVNILIQELSRSGRRVWDLSFSYLQDSDLFPDLSNIGWEGTYDYDYEASGNTLLDDNTFYSQVIHKTNGGQLPFIFQPDKDNNNPDQFAICKFDMKEFKFEQVANGVYNVKLKIREVW